jgi:hypothetical protein
MLIPLLVQNLGGHAPTGTGDLDFTVVESIRDLRLEGASVTIDGIFSGFTNGIGVYRQNAITAGSHTLMITLPGYNTLNVVFNVATGFTTIAIFRLVPLINRFFTEYNFPSIVWLAERYGPTKEMRSQ